MTALLSLFIGLAVFGAGVTLVDILGFLGHGQEEGDADAHADADADADSEDGGDSDHGDHGDHGEEGIATHSGAGQDHDGSLLAVGSVKARKVARVLGILRTAVYFSLGSGIMGTVAVLTKQGFLPAVLWASISGFLMAAIARGLRMLIRRELDSSIKENEYILQTGEVTIPIEEGQLGKLRLRLYGREAEVFARCESGRLGKGDPALVTGYADGVYTVRAAEALPPPDEQEKKT